MTNCTGWAGFQEWNPFGFSVPGSHWFLPKGRGQLLPQQHSTVGQQQKHITRSRGSITEIYTAPSPRQLDQSWQIHCYQDCFFSAACHVPSATRQHPIMLRYFCLSLSREGAWRGRVRGFPALCSVQQGEKSGKTNPAWGAEWQQGWEGCTKLKGGLKSL